MGGFVEGLLVVVVVVVRGTGSEVEMLEVDC